MKEIFKISGVPLKKKLECTILGACLQEIDAFKKISKVVYRQDFSGSNIEVFDALFNLFENNLPIDQLSVSKQILVQLNATKKTEKDIYIRISQYLISLSELVCSTANLKYHALALSQITLHERLIKQLEMLINKESLPNYMLNDFVLFRKKLEYVKCDPIDLLYKSNQFFKLKYPNQSDIYKEFIEIESEFEDRIIEINNDQLHSHYSNNNKENNYVNTVHVKQASDLNLNNELPF